MTKTCNRNDKGESTWLEKAATITEKYFSSIITSYIAIAVCVPLLLYLYASHCGRPTWTTDGLLGYVATILNGAVMLVVAMLALYQTSRTLQAQREQAFDQRRNEIRPLLEVSVKDVSRDCCQLLELTVANHALFSARDLSIQYDYPLHIHDLLEGTETRLISINDAYPKSICVFEEDFDYTGDGFPQKVILGFSDVDNNFIFQTFRYTIESWMNTRNQLIHALLSKKTDAVSEGKQQCAEVAKDLTRDLDNLLVKRFKKNNNLRKSIEFSRRSP